MAATTFQTSAIDTLLRFFSSVTPLSPHAAAAICNCLVLEKFPRKHLLQQQQRMATHLYIVGKGMLRSFYRHKGKEVTTALGLENCVICALDGLLSHEPSFYNIETLEESEIISIAFSDLEALYNDFHEIERLGRLMITRYYLEQEAGLRSLRFKTAEERYRELETTNPELLQRAPLGYLASYLGITQATLSRIRSRY
ncbi:Crp/Fnr family transcriptional regulator [Chitinophaga lutea]|uniref:Crp/Fnr family transcriptional regulator n=1 Tax=Chitinophaga lutea TaxID=2488634 RepID=A0A3N4Q835_9BACT|nr:Crp/Fnr family transcriptional regulator [Chitinophaga lutea]RPE13711.1 Crp/Fnr family transcriptional regulator [Chitinophaga lutea]